MADTNVIGKSRMFPLFLVGKAKDLCFGVVGTKGFCNSKGCMIKSHAKKFWMGCNSGWFIATKSQVFWGKPATFIARFLDSARIMENRLFLLKNPLTKKTAAE